ncbi:SDR family oxidoreductase [Hyphomonas johnsonii]|uniref:Short chain dehydrogenase n=1 Tax=Hyphomonas johnsonii MHS-2 TaxID=1280950 RepID=A0A059FU85_9PROT|nr:SDR family oxidoreductase [Hyphomonas johnsonii]KCZ94270.1 short chain dehydrogenase [Hyphomonas johnsonii MHS-2]
MRFNEKVAIVTGAGQGIGEAYAKALANEGASVCIAEINTDNAKRVADEIVSVGGRAIYTSTDVSSENSCAECVAQTVEAFGGLDYLVNNAAIFAGMVRKPWMEIELEYYRKFMAVNFESILLMTRAAYPAMKARGVGSIVNQSSTAAYYAGNYYGLAKLGVNGLTIALAKELGPQNIRVNGVAPGPTDTEATRTSVAEDRLKMIVDGLPLRRLGQTDDIVKMVLFLLSNDSDWITGQTISVDGGQMMRP